MKLIDNKLNWVPACLLDASDKVQLAQRYYSMVEHFPNLEDDFAPYISLEKKREIIDQFGYPIKYIKSEGGYFRLNSNKFKYSNIDITMEIRQAVTFTIGFKVGEQWRGGSIPDIAYLERFRRGEEDGNDFPDAWRRKPWCYTEAQLHEVLSVLFGIFDDLCHELSLKGALLPR